jgi:uncharacterized protein (TIGR02246 family)
MSTTTSAQDEQIAAIKAVVAELERAQQNELPEDFVALFRSDAVWTTAHGKRLTGRDEIGEFTRRVLPGAMTESTATYEVTHVVFVRADVAIVQICQRQVTLSGELLTDRAEGRPTYVMAIEQGAWKIISGQNTQVVEP